MRTITEAVAAHNLIRRSSFQPIGQLPLEVYMVVNMLDGTGKRTFKAFLTREQCEIIEGACWNKRLSKKFSLTHDALKPSAV